MGAKIMKLQIATPSFGRAKYLQQTIDSVSKQTIPTGHIVCFGGSHATATFNSATAELLYEDPDPGMVGCWNRAASYTTADYIAFLADDNTLNPDFSEKMVGFLENNPECDLVFCNQEYMRSDSSTDSRKALDVTNYFGRGELRKGVLDRKTNKHLIEKNSIPLEACIIRRKIWQDFGPFCQEAKGSFDMEFLYRLILSDRVIIGFLPDYLMNFRWHQDSYCARQSREHLLGNIWSQKSLQHVTTEYRHYFKDREYLLKGRLLRQKLSTKERLDITTDILRTRYGVYIILKNSLAYIFGR